VSDAPTLAGLSAREVEERAHWCENDFSQEIAAALRAALRLVGEMEAYGKALAENGEDTAEGSCGLGLLAILDRAKEAP
jgi:hypothetical protein